MRFSKKAQVEELLMNAELCKGGVEVEASGNDVGYCSTNNNASGCGC